MVPAEMRSASWSSGWELQDNLDDVDSELSEEERVEGGIVTGGGVLRGTGLRAVMARSPDQMHPEPPPTAAVVVAMRKRSRELR